MKATAPATDFELSLVADYRRRRRDAAAERTSWVWNFKPWTLSGDFLVFSHTQHTTCAKHAAPCQRLYDCSFGAYAYNVVEI